MGVFVTIRCDADVGEGTCVASVLGRLGEDIDQTVRRASAAGWTAAGTRYRCPWHSHGRPGGTGLALHGRGAD